MVTGKAGCACSARRCIACVMPSRKNASAFSLLAVSVGRGHQLLGLGHGERGEEVREDGLQRAAQPDVEEVRQVGVADVVVVRRIGGDDSIARQQTALRIRLESRTLVTPLTHMASSTSCHLRRSRCRCLQSPTRSGLASAVVPGHRDRLPPERTSKRLVSRQQSNRRSTNCSQRPCLRRIAKYIPTASA